MTLPNDSLGRWWGEGNDENKALVQDLERSLVRFLAFGKDREADIAGTGFVIAGTAGVAIALTAKHVVAEGVTKIQRPHMAHAPSSPFAAPTRPRIGRTDLGAVWITSSASEVLSVEHLQYCDTLDIACSVILAREGSSFLPTSIPLDTTVPQVGDLIHMVSISYPVPPEQAVREMAPPLDKRQSAKGQELQILYKVRVRAGVVTGVHPDGVRGLYPWPCFTTSIPASPGMSGGFVYLPRATGPVAACGVVCADASDKAAHTDFNLCGDSIIGCSWPALALSVPPQLPAKPDEPLFTLHEMMTLGRMPEALGLDRVALVRNDQGEPGIARKRND